MRNAALIQPGANNWHWENTGTLIGNPYPGNRSYFKNNPSDDYWLWPGCGFQPEGNDTLYVYNAQFRKKGIGTWGWEEYGNPVWAKVTANNMQVAAYSEIQNFNGINFGIGFIKESDGYIYAFGARQTFIYNNIYVARFPANDPNARWRFWAGTGWSTNIKDVRRVGESASSGAAVVKYKDKYVIISTEFSVGCDQGKRLYFSTSNNPTERFTPRKEFYQIPERLDGHLPFFYAPNAHPQCRNEGDELLITYDINGYGDCVNTCKGGRMDPDIYRPKAIRVPYALLRNK